MENTLTRSKTASYAWLAAWAAASMFAITASFLTTLPLLWNFSDRALAVLPEVLVAAFAGAFFGWGVGVALGLAQWIVLRARGQASRNWVIASVLGGIVGGLVVMVFSASFGDDGENMLVTVVSFALFAAVIGSAQYLGDRAVARNAGWVLASTIGLGLGAGIPFAGENLELLRVALGGLVYGIITAAALWWYSQR